MPIYFSVKIKTVKYLRFVPVTLYSTAKSLEHVLPLTKLQSLTWFANFQLPEFYSTNFKIRISYSGLSYKVSS